MSKIIGFTILIGLFGGLHIVLLKTMGVEALWSFLAYPITALIVLAVCLITK